MNFHELVERLPPDARVRLAALLNAADADPHAARESVAPTALVAYYVSASGGDVAADVLRQFLSTSLPAHLVPTLFCRIEQVPRTVHGKVDVAALPAPTQASAAPVSQQTAPSPIEAQLLTIWKTVLGIKRIAPADSFFELGGDSLLAIRLLGQIRSQWNIDLSMADLFDSPTVAGAASRIESVLWARRSGSTSGMAARGETEEVVF